MAENNRFPKAPGAGEASGAKVEIENLGSAGKAVDPSSVKAVAPLTEGIKVRALRPGFFAHTRKSVGDEFVVPSMDKIGSWMRCVDPKVEAQHQEMIQKKKAALK